MNAVFIESVIFEKLRADYLSDDEYLDLPSSNIFCGCPGYYTQKQMICIYNQGNLAEFLGESGQ